MKLQIITKLVRQDPPPPTPNDPEGENRPVLASIHSEYFPKDLLPAPNDRTRKPTPRDFFDSFSSRVYVRYQKVEHPPIQVRRKLEAQLAALKPTLRAPHSDYEFTFKKAESAGSSTREGTGREPTSIPKEGSGQRDHTGSTSESDSLQKDPRKQYYLHQKTKIKLRKFHSLIAFKNEDSDRKNSIAPREQPQRKNLSVVKRNESGLLRGDSKCSGKTLECSYISRKEDNAHVKTESNLVGSKAEGGLEEEKERLARIRRELNEIYQMRKPAAQFKLKLY